MKFLLLIFTFYFVLETTHAQPYIDTHIVNKNVEQNVFINRKVDETNPPAFNDIKSKLPQPIWPSRPDVIRCYWRAWELSFNNLHQATPANTFVSPFINMVFNGNMFMWDTGFMSMFGRYGNRAFNFQHSLDNFYAKQHKDGFICRELREKDGTEVFERFDPSSTGPNILPWAEWDYFLSFNDTTRLKEIYPPLLAYYQWFKKYRTWPDGSYFATGWSSGMDNQPRLPEGFMAEWDHAQMAWIDTNLQQIYAAKTLIKIANTIQASEGVADLENEIIHLTQYVNKYMWNDQSNFYYDRKQDGSLSNVKSIASYWALIAAVVPINKQDAFIQHLNNKDEFARVHRVPTLSADEPDFNPNGGYWRGAVWAPTNYMVLRGLTNYKQDSLAFEIALNHLNNVVEVYTKTGYLRENYAPDKVQGNSTLDYVGWTGLVPISVLFEYVFGIQSDFANKMVEWDVRLLDEFGVTNYPFGKNGSINFLCKKRKKLTDVPSVVISSNVACTVKLTWAGGSKIIEVFPGK
jgi:hypothetical protein